jgi:hypothetical protein
VQGREDSRNEVRRRARPGMQVQRGAGMRRGGGPDRDMALRRGGMTRGRDKARRRGGMRHCCGPWPG